MNQLLRSALLVIALAMVAEGQSLEVKLATARKIDLAWSGSASGWAIERKSGTGPFEKIADTPQPAYEDTKIAPFGTYTYRVRGAGAANASNEVTAGPPPAGVLKPALAPKGADADNYGERSALALDENGDAAFAFLWFDPSGQGKQEESEILFVRWSRTKYKWLDPVKVAVTGKPDYEAGEPIAMAFDAESGIAGIAYAVKDQDGVVLSLSRDGGASWTPTPYRMDLDGATASTALIFRKGHFFLAASVYNGPVLIDGEIGSEPSKWRARKPGKLGKEHHHNGPVALAMNSAGNIFMAFYDDPVDGSDSFLFGIWNAESNKVTKVGDTNGTQPDNPDLKLAVAGGRFVYLMCMSPDDKDTMTGLWVSTSSDGTDWTKPAKMPHDATHSNGARISVAVDTKGRAFAGFGSPSGNDEMGPCGDPGYATSPDGIKWTKCGIGKAAGDTFGGLPLTINVIAAPDDGIYMLWHESQSTKYGSGMLLWHRP